MMGSAVMMGVPSSKGFSVLLRVLNKRTQIMDGKPVPSIFSLRNHIFRMETNKERNKPRKMVKIQCKNPSCHVLPSYRVLFHSNLRHPFNPWTNQWTDIVLCTRLKKIGHLPVMAAVAVRKKVVAFDIFQRGPPF